MHYKIAYFVDECLNFDSFPSLLSHTHTLGKRSKKSRGKVRAFKRGRSWAETQETSLEPDGRRGNWANRIDHRKGEASSRCGLRSERRVMGRKREADKKLRRKRQRRWEGMLEVEGGWAIIYGLGKRRWAVPARFPQCFAAIIGFLMWRRCGFSRPYGASLARMMEYAKTLNDKEGCVEGEQPRPRVSSQYGILVNNIFPLQTKIAHGEQE